MNKKLIIIIIALIVLSGAIYFVFSNKYRDERSEEQVSASETSEFQPEGLNFASDSEHISNNFETYTNSKYNFSFQYPKGFTVTNFQEGEYGETILVSKQGSKDGFQIFISPFDEPGPLTKERILADVPDMVIENPEQRILKNKVPGLIFFSEEASLGKTREVWFIYPVRNSDSNGVNNGYLYQISTYAELDSWLAKILSTWKFQ